MEPITIISYFNPIIGLILIGYGLENKEGLLKFQSHYRSDFNLGNKDKFCEWKFQSHYRSDFNKI